MGGMSGVTMWHLPSEILTLIFSYLPAEDIGRAASVCSRWSQIAENRRVWCGKSFLSEGGCGLLDALPIVRLLPVLKRVSIRRSEVPHVYLNEELADFGVPDLKDNAVTSAISTLVTENLSVEFLLLDERCSNCLVVQLHELKQLEVCETSRLLSPDTITANLRALSSTLSREPLPNLQSIDIQAHQTSVADNKHIDSDILGALSTCSALNRLVILANCYLSSHTITKFSKLQFLQLQDCVIDITSFFDLFPNLDSLSLDNCSLVGTWDWELCRKWDFRILIVSNMSNEFVESLCHGLPKLERIQVDECHAFWDTLFLGHCPQLCFVEVKSLDTYFHGVGGLPSGLQHLKLNSSCVSNNSLGTIVQGLSRLETLDVKYCNVESLQFLRHCPALTELSLHLEYCNVFQHLYELGRLKSLKKLYLIYVDRDVGPLADTLRQLPQLEVLDVLFLKEISNDLSFLRYCLQLHCLTLHLPYENRMCFQEISNLKELRKLVLSYSYFDGEDPTDILSSLPHLEELDLEFAGTECNLSFLRHYGRLTSFQISCFLMCVSHLTQLRCLKCLRRLTILGLSDENRHSLVEEVLRMPKLEYLCLERDGPNILETWEWRKMLSSCSLKG